MALAAARDPLLGPNNDLSYALLFVQVHILVTRKVARARHSDVVAWSDRVRDRPHTLLHDLVHAMAAIDLQNRVPLILCLKSIVLTLLQSL